MSITIKKLITATLAASAFALCSPVAHATLIVTLSDGTNTVTAIDGGLGDQDPAHAGSVLYVGSVGSWIFSVTSGVSNAPASVGMPAQLSLTSIDVSFGGAGTLTITLTDSNLINPLGTNLGAITSIGGTIVGGGTVSAYSLFNGNPLVNLGSFTGSPTYNFSGGGSTSVDTTGGFGLTNVATITFGAGGGSTNFGMTTTVPEPATLGLLGLGLIGLGLARRKSARRQTSKV